MITASTALILLLLVGIMGIALGYILRFLQMTIAKAQLEVNVRKTLNKAKARAADIIADAHEQTNKLRTDLDLRLEQITTSEQEIEQQRQETAAKLAEVSKTKGQIEQTYQIYHKKLLDLADGELISQENLQQELKTTIDYQLDEYYQSKLNTLDEDIDQKTNQLLVEILPEITRRTVRNNTSVTINISANEIGKVIGREGSNIKAFERYAGVDLIIDDSDNTVSISTFDPKRRLVAKQTLVELLDDGRINREQIQHQLTVVEKRLDEEGLKLLEEGLDDLPFLDRSKITKTLEGHLQRLYFRHSYGQNQLEHSLEVAEIAGAIAARVSPQLAAQATLAGLLHDIGKTVADNSDHVATGLEIIKNDSANLEPLVTKAIAEHHLESSSSIISAIVKSADAISSGRPGARIQSSANYLSRLEKLEKFISQYSTVDNVYAVSGGREVYIFVRNRDYSQESLQQLATTIATDLKTNNLIHAPINLHIIREDEIVQNVA